MCKGNPRKWAGPSRCKQLERLRQGVHPTIDIPLGPEITCKSDACNADHTKLTTEQMARRRAWDKATRRKTVRTKGKGRAPIEDDGGDDFYAEALVRADERNPIYTSEDELTRRRCLKSDLAHVDWDIEQLEGPAKKSRSELFLLPSSTLDNTSSDLLDLRVIEGKLVNPFVAKRKLLLAPR